ncbi:hypothetical protein ACFL6M_07435, partial [Candidatus Eisenbacteria bacterium]
ETSGANIPTTTFDRYRTGAWGSIRSGSGIRLNTRWDWGNSRRDDAIRGGRESKDRTGSATAFLPVKWVGDFSYRFNELSNELVTEKTLLTHRSHVVGFGTDYSLPGNFLAVSTHARSRFFGQTIRSGVDRENLLFLVPLSGGVLLDNTPEEHDPLEPDVQPVPGLYDRNRPQVTSINLGNAAPPADEYGGDYRNIQYDLEDEETIAEATLYVDRIVTFEALFKWHVFVSDDPQGRIWRELEEREPGEVEGDFKVDYEEWSTGDQGWVVTFLTSQTTRYFKMVNVKLGPTTSLPDLLVTELEVYTREATDATETQSDSENHEIGANATLTPFSALRLGYSLSWRERKLQDSDEDRIEEQHGFSSSLRLGLFTLSSRHGIHTLETPNQLNTDLLTHGVTATAGRLTTTLSWAYTRDRSEEVDTETRNTAFRVGWKATPALDISQAVHYGTRDDFARADSVVQSTSVSMTTRLRSRPVPTLRFDLDWNARHVDTEAGSGFTRHNDVRIVVAWSPFALVNILSRTRYKTRDESDWNTRNQINWSPFRGGGIDLSFSGTHYFDSRDHSTQTSVSSILRWRLRPRLSVEGRWTIQRFEEAGVVNVPTNTGIRLVWSF